MGPVARYEMPIDTWRDLMAAHYPNGSWVRLGDQTMEALAARKAAEGLPTYDMVVARLLEEGS